MKNFLLIIFLFLGFVANSQCVSNQSYTLTPAGPYQPGDVVVVNYTLGNFTQLNVNWIHAFQINLGVGWTNLTPLLAPGNPGGSTGSWIWDLQHTFIGGLNFGPGWRFQNIGNVNWGTSSTGPFTMRFRVTVDQTCTADDLSISINVFGDCLTGGWSNGACCTDPAYNIYNGVVQIPFISTSNINHF
tara:strand:- start:4172 stop:4732 length:561 start_codon:yes stop_codon:yes gene_type:complete